MIGETFGNFRIVSRLGRGGMGEVYLAEQQNIGTRVAVKLLRLEISADSDHVQRFFNEARAVSRIQHAGIVKIFDVGHHPSGHAYLVMEYLEGETLARRIQRTGPLHASHIADLGRQIASVLEATHSAGITHRDLKPDNIFIVPDRELPSRQRARVLDFGIAKLTGTLAGNSPQTIGTMGTPAYMAPEQWGDASRVDWRADVYSFGCVLFEMACGRPPFVVTNLAEACGKHLTEVPPTARSIAPYLPEQLDELLAQMLEKRPEDRPQSMDEIARRFDAIAAHVGPALPPSPGSIPTPIPQFPSGSAYPAVNPALGATVGTGYPPPAHGPTVATGYPPAAPSPPPVQPAPRAKRSKLPFVLVGLVGLVIAGVGIGVAAKRGRGNQPPLVTPPVEAIACTEALTPPVLKGSSLQPVKLRYELQLGRKSTITRTLDMTSAIRTKDGTRKTEATTLRIDGALVTSHMAFNTTQAMTDFSEQLWINGIELDRRSSVEEPGKPPEHLTRRFRSDDLPRADATLAKLQSMIGYIVSFNLSPNGRISNDTFPAARDHVANAFGSTELQALWQRDDVLRGMFIELPDQAVKIGDRMPSAELIYPLPSGGEMNAKFELEVVGVSADRTQVLFATKRKPRLDLTGKVKILSEQASFEMWALFDTNQGEVSSSALRACVDAKMEVDGRRLTTEVVLESAYSAKLVQPRHPSSVADPPPAIDAGVRDPEERGAAPGPVDAGVRDAAVATGPGDAAVVPARPGTIDRAAVKRVVATVTHRVRACYDTWLVANPGMKASATAKITVGPSGDIDHLEISGVDKVFAACLDVAIRGLTFPAPSPAGATVTLSYPFSFEAPPVPPPGAGLPYVPTEANKRRVLGTVATTMKVCGERHPGTPQIKVQLLIMPDGSVKRATASTTDRELESCVETAARVLQFERSVNGTTTVATFELQ